MADWLDSADKVASVVGALAGVAALVITVRDKNRRAAPGASPTRNAADPPFRTEPAPGWEPLPANEPAQEPPFLAEPMPAPEPAPDRPWEPEPGAPAQWPVPPGGPAPAQWPVPPGGPVLRPARRGGTVVAVLAYVATVIAYCAGAALLGARLLSWLGGGSIGPWWLLAGLTVSFVIALVFIAAEEPGGSVGMLLLYILWVPMATWLGARAFAYYWFPDLFGNQGVEFTVVLIIGLVIGVAGGFASRR